ncbi:MAG: glycosyltransferase family 4 protein [Bacteroidia bacterium]|nr:glycosyltransferase family 4 protein [Bacteroidia bacterium]
MSAIVIISPGFPKDESDTTCLPAFQQFVLSLQRQFSEHRFIVIALHYPYDEKIYTWHGTTIYALGGKNRGHFYNSIIRRKAYQRLLKIKKEYGLIGLVSLWCTDTAKVGARFANAQGIPHRIWIIGQDAGKDNKHVASINPKPEELMAMSDFLQTAFYKNHHIRPLHVVENGINPETFPPFNSGQRPIDLFGAGWLSPLKNYKLFIDLVADLKKSHPLIRAVIAGEGEERSNLEKQIHLLNLQDNVRLVGLKSHQETLEYMAQSKVFLHTSNYEGNSTVLMEALYSGCQVVSTQALSERPIENLFVSTEKDILLKELASLFSQSITQKQIVFNTMDTSARKIMKLLLGQ